MACLLIKAFHAIPRALRLNCLYTYLERRVGGTGRCWVAATGLLLKRIFSPYVKDGTAPSAGLCACCPPALPGTRRGNKFIPRRALGGSGSAKNDRTGLSLKAYLFMSKTLSLKRLLLRVWGMHYLLTLPDMLTACICAVYARSRGPGVAQGGFNLPPLKPYLFVSFHARSPSTSSGEGLG